MTCIPLSSTLTVFFLSITIVVQSHDLVIYLTSEVRDDDSRPSNPKHLSHMTQPTAPSLPQAIPTMPLPSSIHLFENVSFDIFYEDLIDRPEEPSHVDGLLAHGHASRKALLTPSKAERRIAGNKRVARFREKQGYDGSGQVLQSISAWPALKHLSFEVLCFPPS